VHDIVAPLAQALQVIGVEAPFHHLVIVPGIGQWAAVVYFHTQFFAAHLAQWIFHQYGIPQPPPAARIVHQTSSTAAVFAAFCHRPGGSFRFVDEWCHIWVQRYNNFRVLFTKIFWVTCATNFISLGYNDFSK
jgi:hypothetical protein